MALESVPLFPLNTVLLPRMPLPLHVFEERYRVLVERCIQERTHFGVALIRDGAEVGGPAVPHEVGTLARIIAVQALDGGEKNLLCEGTRRFRLLDYAAGAEPYLVGIAEPVEDQPCNGAEARRLMEAVGSRFQEYFRALVSHAGVDLPPYELPDEPEEFSFVIAAVLQTDAACRQGFLEMTDTVARLRAEQEILERDMQQVTQATGVKVIRASKLQMPDGRQYYSPN